jgi:hypothetical protein
MSQWYTSKILISFKSFGNIETGTVPMSPKSKEMKRKSKTVRLLVNFFNVEA